MGLRRSLLGFVYFVALDGAHTTDFLGCLGFFARLGELLSLRDVFGGRRFDVLGELLGLCNGSASSPEVSSASETAVSSVSEFSALFSLGVLLRRGVFVFLSPATFAAATTPVVAATAANSLATSSTGDSLLTSAYPLARTDPHDPWARP